MRNRKNDSGMVAGLVARLFLVGVCTLGAVALGLSWPAPLAIASVLVFVFN